VLRDLSHELDLLLLLAGPWQRVAALGGNLGVLDIASDECWALLVELERCRCATLQVNYLDRPGRREIVVNTADHTYQLDFGRAALTSDGEVEEFTVDPDATYRAQHRALMTGDTAHLCSLEEGTRVMDLIAAAERAAGAQEWVAA
jgi:hypothetical protein